MGILCVFCVYDTIGNRCFEKTSFPMMVGNVTACSILSILTVAVATLSVNKIKRWLAMYSPRSAVSNLTVEAAILSVNKMKMMVENVYTKFYSVNT